MDSLRTKILRELGRRPACDDCLASRADIQPRQTVNQYCRAMVGSGEISRLDDRCPDCRKTKLVNRLTIAKMRPVDARPVVNRGAPPQAAPVVESAVDKAVAPAPRWWAWEGNVQEAIAVALERDGFVISARADTANRRAGVDLIAHRGDGSELLVSVKGYPTDTEKTLAPTQARHWFAGALLDMALYRTAKPTAKLAVGLPDGFKTYLSLARRTQEASRALRFDHYWVGENGDVRRGPPDGHGE